MSNPISIKTKNGLTAAPNAQAVLAKVKDGNEAHAGKYYYFQYDDKGKTIFIDWADPTSINPRDLARLNDK